MPATIAGFAALTLLDHFLYEVSLSEGSEDEDWYQVLRQAGYLPTWLLIAVCVYLIDRADPARKAGKAAAPVHHRAGLLVLGAGLGGTSAEVLKVVFRRLRPDGSGSYVFRPLSEGLFNGSGLGMPSSHTAVAFGGAVMLGLLVPAVRWPMLVLAAGCGVSRMLAGAHYATDVYVGALVAAGLSLWLYRAGEAMYPGSGVGSGSS